MKKNLFILILISSFFAVSNAQQIHRAEFSIGGTGENGGNALVRCHDGGYAVTGFTTAYGSGGADVYVLKLDSMFHLLWTKTIGGIGDEAGFSMVQTKDHGFAITGVSYSFGDIVNGDVYVIKLDSNGVIQWTKTVGGAYEDVGNCIIQSKDGGYAIAGYTASYGSGNYNMYVIKLDSAGNLKWTKVIGGILSEKGYSIIQSREGDYVITGNSESYGAGSVNIYLVKLDSAGTLKWTKTIGGTNSDAAYSIIQTHEGGYAITGYTESYGIGIQDVYVLKVDTGGNLQWTKTIADSTGKDAGYAIIQTKDNGFCIAAITDYYDLGNATGYLIKLDSAGNLKWTKIVGGNRILEFNSIVQSNDGGYIALGSGTVFYIEKLDSSGNTCDTTSGVKYENSGGIITTRDSGRIASGGSITSSDSGRVSSGGTISTICGATGISNIPFVSSAIKLYPKPCTNTLTINLDSPSILSEIQILDITGRVLFTDPVRTVQPGGHCPLSTDHYSIDVSSLSSGMYFIRINTGSGIEVQKFIKE
ncbi:MAG TPA: T9SS type A sorting domain-containing protein [Bacteroidia bacterium]|nr:T9SS type A sorting domain-containing protein [Bacteroidia bacterium]